MGHNKPIVHAIRLFIVCTVTLLLVLSSFLFVLVNPRSFAEGHDGSRVVSGSLTYPNFNESGVTGWVPPDTSTIPETADGSLIRYGYRLVSHTAVYLGPKGNVSAISNGMNCQNCHLDAGSRPFGNNYSAVASTYPKYRPRSGTIETIEKRVNDCIERSLNGKPLNHDSREMKAFVAYIIWLGKSVPRESVPLGSGILTLPFLGRPASATNGKIVYATYCVRCHGERGEGVMNESGVEWKYPPLYGDSSYNTGAGLYRLSRLAGFVKVNMPYDIATIDRPILTDEECWDVAAYINSQLRPSKAFPQDWPDISRKPFDHPFGPYADRFTEGQHKYGPYINMVRAN